MMIWSQSSSSSSVRQQSPTLARKRCMKILMGDLQCSLTTFCARIGPLWKVIQQGAAENPKTPSSAKMMCMFVMLVSNVLVVQEERAPRRAWDCTNSNPISPAELCSCRERQDAACQPHPSLCSQSCTMQVQVSANAAAESPCQCNPPTLRVSPPNRPHFAGSHVWW